MINKKYKVKVEEDWGDLYLSITHNGTSWSSLSIKNPDYEIPKIIEALSKYLKEKK